MDVKKDSLKPTISLMLNLLFNKSKNTIKGWLTKIKINF